MQKICRKICKKYDKYAKKYDKYAMWIYFGKYARKYAKYAKSVDHAKNMQNMHSSLAPCWWNLK
jgi:DNA-directed RNA polymerase subunit K/omega